MVDDIITKARAIVYTIIGSYEEGAPLHVVDVKARVKGFLSQMEEQLWYDRAFSEGGWNYLISSCIAKASGTSVSEVEA